jgi:hypothetical protein
MRLKAPEEFRPGLSVGGQYFAMDADGCIEVPDGGDYSMLAPLGFMPYVARESAADHEAE